MMHGDGHFGDQHDFGTGSAGVLRDGVPQQNLKPGNGRMRHGARKGAEI
jgi:hypothetical protein